MHDDDLRALIRDAIARHLSSDGRDGSGPASRSLGEGYKSHLSHGRFVFLAPTDPDAPCVVEPQVRCHHCGFCQSYGH
ncbi:hypothetical protein [Luteitalea sp.]|uniref:hypothetical protein n=1 Tax=Luteitalea sp. TaxID=2004800 RepID=UPI0025C4C9A5|nr:hypothetical protein [Luteitalea sp.]